MPLETPITPDRIAETERLIRPHVRHTPVVSVDLADFGGEPRPVALKLECLQHSGSFKARGAFANLLTRPIPACGVVAASGGNHGTAVAYAAMRLGVPATIFLPSVTSPSKVERIRSYARTWSLPASVCRRVGGKERTRESARCRACIRPAKPCSDKAASAARSTGPARHRHVAGRGRRRRIDRRHRGVVSRPRQDRRGRAGGSPTLWRALAACSRSTPRPTASRRTRWHRDASANHVSDRAGLCRTRGADLRRRHPCAQARSGTRRVVTEPGGAAPSRAAVRQIRPRPGRARRGGGLRREHDGGPVRLMAALARLLQEKRRAFPRGNPRPASSLKV